MSSRFDNQVAVITGGARGQGRSHALALAREGCSIALVDVPDSISSVTYPMSTAADLAATAEEVEACGVECLTFAADVRNLAALEEMTATVTGALGHISILVANAGVMAGARIDKMTGEQWREIIDTNLTGVFNSIRAVSLA